MEEEIQSFATRLASESLCDQLIIQQKLHRFLFLQQPLLVAKLNNEFFTGDKRLVVYLKQALTNNPRASQFIRKRIYNFIASYIETHHTYILDHVKSLFSDILTLFWREENKIKEISIGPLRTMIQIYDEQFLVASNVNPVKLHSDIMTMLLTQKTTPGVIGQCWHLLSVVQNKFTTLISSQDKKKVQEISFMSLKNYVKQNTSLNTIAALLRGLACSLRENYLPEESIAELFKYIQALIIPLKSTYNVPLAALELLEARRQNFRGYIMENAYNLFDNVKAGVVHKNKDYRAKCLQVLIVLIEQFVEGIRADQTNKKRLFNYVIGKVLDDLQTHVNKGKGVTEEYEKSLNMLTIIHMLAILSPLYLQFEGKKSYKSLFNYLIKKCSRRLLKDYNFSSLQVASGKGTEIKYLLYSQKEMICFVSSLSHLVEQLQEVEYDEANLLESIFIEAIKQSRYFLKKYEKEFWEASVRLIMSMQLKGPIFFKWLKKVISESLRECLDSKKMLVEDDEDYIKMISKAGHLWKSILGHSSWRAQPLQQLSQHLLSNIQYLILNLDCGYRVRTEDKQQFEMDGQKEEGIVQIFFIANQRIEINNKEDYQYLSSLSLLFNQILTEIDPTLFNRRLMSFYPELLERIKLYPKCLPLLRTLRALNEYILRTDAFKIFLNEQLQFRRQLLYKMRNFFNETIENVFKFQQQYFYQLLKVLLSFSQEVYLLDNHRIVRHHLPLLLIRTLELGQEIISLADGAVRCLQRMFTTQRTVSEQQLLSVVPALQKFINIESKSEREQFKSQMFLSELKVTRQSVSEAVLSFLGSLGGLCHQLVDNTTKDHISWDYDCQLCLQLTLLNQKYEINLTRMLNRICWLSVNGSEESKIVACELLHAYITYVIEEVYSKKMDKENLSVFLDKILPTVLGIAGNTSHPSQQLLHTLLIQIIHFFANTKEPNSPDIQIILKHLLSLYNKSQDLGYLASKCLAEFIRWHIKQQPSKNGDLPVLKALMGNIWSLVGNKHAKEGIINFLFKLLRIIHRQTEIMRYFALEFGSLLISLTRSHQTLQPEFRRLLEKYTLCLNRYMKYLLIPEDGRRYKKLPTIHAFLDHLYRVGFFSIYCQQRQASFFIWSRVVKDNSELLGYNQRSFLKERCRKETKYLFGNSSAINFQEAQENTVQKLVWRVVALGQVWLKMLELGIFTDDNLVQFADLECVYLVSFANFIIFLIDYRQHESAISSECLEEGVVANFTCFLRIINRFTEHYAETIVLKFIYNIEQRNLTQHKFNSMLFEIVFAPEKVLANVSRDERRQSQLDQYMSCFVNYVSLRAKMTRDKSPPLLKVFMLIEAQLRLDVSGIVEYFCEEQTAGERKIKSIGSLIKIGYAYQLQRNMHEGENSLLKGLLHGMMELLYERKIKPEREMMVITFLTAFKYPIIDKFIAGEIEKNGTIYQRYEKIILNYVVINWRSIAERVVDIALQSIDSVKLLFILCKKLPDRDQQYLMVLLASREAKQNILRDLIRVNYLFVQKYSEFTDNYQTYIQGIVEVGLRTDHSIEINEEALYLSGLIIKKQLRIAADITKLLKATLNSFGNKYCPYTISKLKTPEAQETAIKYFYIIRNFIVISEEFQFIEQFFVVLKDRDLSVRNTDLMDEYIEDCARTCFTLDGPRPMQWAEQLLKYYWDEEMDKDEWINFRFVIIERILKRVIPIMKVEAVQQLFQKYINSLEGVLKKPLAHDSIKGLLLDFQIKKGAFLIIELFYANLPRRGKKQGGKNESQIHKVLIKYCVEVSKKFLDESYKKLIREHDAVEGMSNKAMKVYKQYNCHAFNCLIMLFIATQSNKDHFKSFIFQHNKQALWSNLVDTDQEEFGFQILTDFKVMKPYNPLRNKVKEIKTKIERTYFQSSLYVVEEENVPHAHLPKIQEQNEDQNNEQPLPVNSANNLTQNINIEEDVINKHPCMINLLRVIDFLHANFPEAVPGWMKPIDLYLTGSISLAERILLIKLILNRPNIFTQADIWAKHLLFYLSEKQTGGKFIHYFFRDALKQFINFLPQMLTEKPEPLLVNKVIMKLIRSLPYDNINVYTDNIDMLQALLRLPRVIIERPTLDRMLKSDDKDEKKNEWRMCAIIVIKLCISYKIPILSNEQYPIHIDRATKYQYYYVHIKQQLKYIFEMALESSKKYRIAAAGMLGEYLAFILNSELPLTQKEEHFRGVSTFITSLVDKTTSRGSIQKFTLALQKIALRFPNILTDEKVFSCLEDGLVHFNGAERQQLLIALREYCKNELKFNQTGKICNFFMTLRTNCEKIIADTIDVQLVLFQLLNLCTDSRLLRIKDVMFTYYLVAEKLSGLNHINEKLSMEYYQILIKIKKFLVDPEAVHFQFGAAFQLIIEDKLIEGLSNKFGSVTKLIFDYFQNEVDNIQETENVMKYLSIFKRFYKKKHEEMWLISVVPLLLTLCRSSSDYGRLFSQAKLENNMAYYDWDFRNFKINDASLPYTPSTIYDKKKEGGSQRSVGPSQAGHLRGLIRQTQNSYMSQQDQIFSMLESLSQQQPEASQIQGSLQQGSQMGSSEEEKKFSQINDLFKNKRKRNQVMEDWKQNNFNKTSPAVKFIENKIRFSKKSQESEEKGQRKRFKRNQVKENKKGAILRAYKLGELPSIDISVQLIVQPLIFLTSKDYELSSELFLQITGKICTQSLKNCDLIKDTLFGLMKNSEKYEFNFISTLSKGLIKICQKHNKFMDISLKTVALKSNTLDYAVLFTEQNIIQGMIQIQMKQGFEGLRQRKQMLYHQWFDLTDYYQLLNEHDLIQAVIIRISEGDQRTKMIKALTEKRQGDLNEARKHIEQIMKGGIDARLNSFFEKERIDCSVLLSEWEELCTGISERNLEDSKQNSEQNRMFIIALTNLQPQKRIGYLDGLQLQEKYQYQKGILFLMKEGGMDGARFHALNSRKLFRQQWHRISSFAFNSKHDLLQTLQKNHELIQFLQIDRQLEVREKDCKELFQKWSKRRPDQIFDENMTWIQILSSRLMLGKMLANQWSLSIEQMAKYNTEWLIQVVNGMLCKGVLGYAENIIRKALQQHKLSREFNWQFYESISRLKLLQIIKKSSLKLQEYEIVPKLIQREMNQYNNNTELAKLRLMMIKNEYLEGYLEVSLSKRKQMDIGIFVGRIVHIFGNYDELKKVVKNNASIQSNVKRQVHFRYALFLQNLLSMIRGKFQIKQVKQSIEKQGINIKLIATNFIEQLIYSIKLLNLSRSSTLNYEQGQQLFSMILKLIKIVQSQHKTIGKYFEDAITDKHIPKWIFIYFIPQIIKNINSYEISIYFKELFEYLVASHPQSLIYPFSCSYPHKKDCVTELTKYLHIQLSVKMNKYFEFINNLFLLQHPEMRLKDILTKYLHHGQSENAFLQLQQFVSQSQYMGKYNMRFYQNWKQRLDNIFELKKRGQFKQLQNAMKTAIISLEPAKCSMMKFFVKVSDGSTWFEEYNSSDWMRLEVPGTSYTQFEEPQSWNKVYIESFEYNLLTLSSIRKPKRITLLGSNQKVYMLLIKGGEDVRLDQRVEELFGLVNRIMYHNPQTNKKLLQISRFEVVPMKPMFGVFQWVDKSKTLRSFLEAELKQLKGKPEANFVSDNQAVVEFVQYFRKLCPGVEDKHIWHKTLMGRSEEQVVRNISKCENKVPYGLLRFALQKLAKNYDSFLHIKNKFISNYSAICLITYIFGIGDRHLDNFLIQTSTGNLVMIDFGYSFGASIELPIPELIPFRLTKIFRELAAPIGIEGSFKKCMLACFEAMFKKMQLIVDYCDVFVDDPLMEWVWVSRRQLGQASKQPQYVSQSGQSFSVTQEAPERKLFSNKIKIVENKLRGYNPRLILEQLINDSRHKQATYVEHLKKAIWGKAKTKADILSSQDLINELLSLATDKNILGRSYIGLNLFV